MPIESHKLENEGVLFTSLRQLASDLSVVLTKIDTLSGEKNEELAKFEAKQKEAMFRLRFQAFLTIVILFGGAYILFFTTVDDSSKKWVTGIMGGWLGYWIR